jgi:predicted histidine transporter YuiF (NhaC family)
MIYILFAIAYLVLGFGFGMLFEFIFNPNDALNRDSTEITAVVIALWPLVIPIIFICVMFYWLSMWSRSAVRTIKDWLGTAAISVKHFQIKHRD